MLLAAAPARADVAMTAPAQGAALPAFQTTAPIALMVDMGSGRTLFARDERRRFIPASLTKIMTAYVAFELIDAHRLGLDQTMPVRDETWRQWHGKGTSMNLAEGSSVTVEDLLRGIVTVSANDGCVVLAEGIAGDVPHFTTLMNAAAHHLGMPDTHYNTPNGWPDDGRTYVSAADLATLSSALISRHPGLYHRFFGHKDMTFNGVTQENFNPLYGVTAGADGVKTGHTNEAGYGLVGSAERDGRRLLMVVAGFDTLEARRNQSRAFIEWGYSAWETQPLFNAGVQVAEARVQGGTDRMVGLLAPRDLRTVRPTGTRAGYGLTVRYRGPLTAPLAKGQPVATLVVHTDGQPDASLPLVAANDVGRGGAIDRLRNGLFALAGL